MGYYKGDFYGRGGYYRGDPGFFSFLGNIAKKAVGFIPGVGPAISAGLDMLPALGAKKASSAIVKAGEGTLATRGMGAITKIVKGHPVLSAAGAAGAVGLGAGMAAPGLMRGAKHLLGGGRKRRRMNPCNARALRRAIRRATAFEHLAKKVIGFSSPRKPKGHMYFKRKRKR